MVLLERVLTIHRRHIIDVQSLVFSPTPDNITLVSDPAKRRLSGNIAKIPVLGGTNAQEGRVIEYGQNDTTAFLISILGPDKQTYIKEIEAAYPLGEKGLNTPFDQLAQIFTELAFQCPQALWANDSAKVGIPTWRYYFNASFMNTQLYVKPVHETIFPDCIQAPYGVPNTIT